MPHAVFTALGYVPFLCEPGKWNGTEASGFSARISGGGLEACTTVSALVGDQQGWTGFLVLRTRHCGIHRLLVYREARRSHLWLHGRLRGILDAAPCVATNPLTAPENRPLGRRRLCSLPPLLSRGGHDGHLRPVRLPSCSIPAKPLQAWFVRAGEPTPGTITAMDWAA